MSISHRERGLLLTRSVLPLRPKVNVPCSIKGGKGKQAGEEKGNKGRLCRPTGLPSKVGVTTILQGVPKGNIG